MTKLLDSLNLPTDLADLNLEQLNALSDELRSFMIESVTKTGGHLSSSLGVVELTVALHAIFESPKDKIVWDVGHQSYPHKILTGRKDVMQSLRQYKGLSGFTKRTESAHDSFGTGHSSTSISAALGMAYAMKQNQQKGHAIAVIGDGALTGGMAFEALNHAGDSEANLLVVLNDNKMSISENVGAMSRYLGRVLSSRPYSSMRENSRKVLSKIPKAWDFAKKAEEHFKGMLVPGTLFEELGFHYIGPIDGHDINTLLRALRIMKKLDGPQFLHVITTKGKGHEEAEKNPIAYHGVAAASSPKVLESRVNTETYTQVFGSWLCNRAKTNEQLVGITPAMREGSGLVEFSEKFPERFIDVGIAEQHAVTLAAGMACENLLPVVAIYSTFLQRAYDQLIHDVAIQNLHVIFAIDRAGLVGADGPTHAGVFDLSFLRCVPSLVVMAPAYKQEFVEMLDLSVATKAPIAVRYPRGNACLEAISHSPVELGKANKIKEGGTVAVLVFGTLLPMALEALEGLAVTVVNMRFIKPLDVTMIDELANSHEALVTLEENVISGGAGSAVQEYLNAQNCSIKVRHLGLPDYFVEHGEVQVLLSDIGLDKDGIRDSVSSLMA